MNGSINYIVTTNVLCRPIIKSPSELESLHEDLLKLNAEQNGGLEILDTKRVVITPAGKVVYTQVALAFNEYGLEIHDAYRNMLDSYYKPEPEPLKKKKFRVRRAETWVNEQIVWADTEEEAVAITESDVADGGFDVLDGWLEEPATWVVDVETEGETK